jgi:hypothetical protein
MAGLIRVQGPEGAESRRVRVVGRRVADGCAGGGGYFHWSMRDNFEVVDRLRAQFGLLTLGGHAHPRLAQASVVRQALLLELGLPPSPSLAVLERQGDVQVLGHL